MKVETLKDSYQLSSVQQDLSKAEGFWRQLLHGFTAPTPLVVDEAPQAPRQEKSGFKEQELRLSKASTSGLQSLAQQHQLTLNTLVQGAWALLLWRYSGEADVVFGASRACRHSSFAESESMVGLLLNILPVRVGVSPEMPLLPWLKQLQAEWIALGDYEYTPLDKIQGWSDLPSGTPLFDSIVVFENYPTTYPLTLVGYVEPELLLQLKYDLKRFDDATIARMLGHIQTLLEAMPALASQRLVNLPFLTEAERHQQLVEWNDTQADYPQDLCIHQLFEAQVTRSPDAVAVIFEDEQLTYWELNLKANRIAHYLRSLEVGPEVLVGICMDRSFEMIVGLLGILKAGGAYVPLDPTYPQERLALMLEDTQVSVLLTQARQVEKLPPNSARVICLDTEWETIANESQENPDSRVTPDNLAYVMYTSGSTGTPKGVQCLHKCPVNRFSAEIYPFEAEDICCQKTSLNFVDSIWEIFAPLSQGLPTVIITNEVLKDPHRLVQTLAQQQITRIMIVPSLLRVMLDTYSDLQNRLPKLKYWFCGGEALSVDLSQRFVTQMPQAILLNLYGLSELWDVTWYDTSEPSPPPFVPNGRPIANVQVYILDSHLQPVPVGVRGELHVGGVGLSRGYLNRADLTAEKFIPNPFSDEPGARLYKTGDLARYNSDGNIEYIGRIDNQVKIRGFRIELSEIEAVLRQHPAVQTAVVIAREDVPGQKRLVAYVVQNSLTEGKLTKSKQAPPIKGGVPWTRKLVPQMRSFLQEKLPDYMVPSNFVILDAVPLTPSGKVDRRALPVPDQIRPEMEEDFVAPRTPVEEVLAGIWAQVLKLERVGVHDNFLELGGNSLLATQLTSQVRTTLAVELPLRSLFEAPTVAGLAKCIETARGQAQVTPALSRVLQARDKIPLSFAQARLWFLDQLEPGSAFYNIPASVHLGGKLNRAALEHSLNEIISRHEALRTNFATVEGQPVQVIHPALTLRLPVVDLRYLPESERKIETERLATEEAQRPFELAKQPLVRATLLQLTEAEHVLLLTMHHIVSDGWSLGVFFCELAALYESCCTNKRTALPELPIQYADYAVWQRQWLQGEVRSSQLAYWKQQLEGATSVLELPTDRPRPAVKTFRGAQQSLALSKELSEALTTLSQREGVTLFMTLLAAFQTLLYRYTGQTDVLVGTPIANRNLAQIEGLIGLFVNTLVLRTYLGGNPSFQHVLSRVREVALGAYAHQDVPFEEVVEALQTARDLSNTPLFQVMFVLQNVPMPNLELIGLNLTPLTVETGTAKFDLTLSLTQTELGLIGSLVYNTDLFDAATIARMAGHFQTLLEGIVANPLQHLAELPLLTESEQHQLLVEWNNTQAEYPQDLCIHELFEAQVVRTPDAPAVVFENQQLTYRELNARANCLAHHLQLLGVKPDVLVGICMERSLSMVVGLLGILKAGGAYVPLDPAYPQERLASVLEDASVPVLLTQQQVRPVIPELRARVVCLDTDWEVISQESEENPVCAAKPASLAYVIYTSGSTGKPKGVAIEHCSVLNLASGLHKAIYAHQDSRLRVSLNGSLAFDTSVKQVIQLLYGHTLEIVPSALRFDGDALLSYLQTSKIDVFDCTPSQLRLLITAGLLGGDAAPKYVLVGGEPIDEATWATLAQAKNINFYNVYGPTECTVDATYCPVLSASVKPVIGRPIANTQIYILDHHLQPVPIGIPGELHIGGAGLARGYLNRPELTEQKFIPNPFSNQPGARLYKTGDKARYNSDGNIEYIGRLDHQVKIRGFRIELGEIEAVLTQTPAVREAVVIARSDQSGDQRLVAYVVPYQQGITPSELRHFLTEKLPDYMVPGAFAIVEALPLTPNGKVDHRALSVLDTSQRDTEEGFVPPRTITEDLLAAIWTYVLGLEQVGIYDNFFELGGHSLLATQIISRVRDTFCVELPVRCLFELPTVAGLSEHIEAARCNNHQEVLLIEAGARDGELPLSFAQARLWFLDRLEGESATYNIPVALKIIGSLNVHALEQSLTEIVRRHETLRTTFPIVNGSAVQVIAQKQTVKVPVVDLQLPEEEQSALVRQLATKEAHLPFDLALGPLLRATLLQLEKESHVLLVTMHHIVSDGWSMGIFIRELTTLYEAASTQAPSPLPELPIQYGDFAVWQRQWLTREVLETQLTYWKQQLAGAPPLLELPTDRPRPSVQTFRGCSEHFQLNLDLTRKLKTLSQRSEATLFMTLLAAFVLLLSRYSRQEDIVVGAPIANRNRSETESLIGFFVNTLVLRTHLGGNPTFQQMLSRLRQVALDAYAHQDVPFEKLVEALQPERNLSHNPLFQVMFVLQNAPMERLELPGLTLTPLEIESSGAKFDLTLSIEETESGLRGSWEYNTDLFDATTIRRMVGHFQTLLEGIVANPQQHLAELPLLTVAQGHQLLVEWNDTQTDYPQNSCIHQLFEAQVERTPNAVAVVFEDKQLTYRELNARANCLAHYLQFLGVGPEVLVGICIERSLEMVVGLLGILKAGGAYVPLDPAYPQERLAFMLADTQTPVLLTQARLVESLTSRQARILCLDTDWEAIAAESEENSTNWVTPDNLAYVIYTSGSTGEPKGVAVPHRAVNRLVLNTNYVNLEPKDVVAQVSNCSFDAATFEIWGALLHGARLVGVTRDVVLSPQDFAAYLREQGISVLFLTTALFNQIAKEVPSAFNSVRHLLFGGEAVDPRWCKEVLKNGPPQRLLHVYGPTESTTFTSWYLVSDVPCGSTTIPIGRPLSNTQIYVLDAQMQPVPIGAPGELYIGGAGLARGYLNRPDLTALAFIPNPFSDVPGARLYKTGDLVRYLPDGNIEFLGRIDHQMKLRGFRIEPGEIEAVLSHHPAVRQTIVLAREDTPGDKRLVAYVVPYQEHALTPSELRRFLKEQLPEYMVPSAFVMLPEKLPLTPNGKVDRRALPNPEGRSPELEAAYVAPQTEVEQTIAAVWQELLHVEKVGLQDNFFELGGHSLLAVRLFAQLQKIFDLDLPVATLFQAPTVEQLASRICQSGSSAPISSLVKIQPGGSKPPFFGVHGAGDGVFVYYYYNLVPLLGPEQPIYGLQPQGLDGLQLPHSRIEDMAAHYIREIRTIQPVGPYFLGGASLGGKIVFEMAQQLHAQGEKVAMLVLFDTHGLESFKPLPFHVRASRHLANLLRLELKEKLTYVQKKLARRFYLDNRQPLAPAHLKSPLFEALDQANRDYVPQVYPGRAILFRVSERSVDLSEWLRIDPELGWGSLVAGGLEIQDIPGNHYNMFTEPYVPVLAAKLKACLDSAQVDEQTPSLLDIAKDENLFSLPVVVTPPPRTKIESSKTI